MDANLHNSCSLQSVVAEFLEGEELKFNEYKDEPTFALGMRGRTGSWMVRIHVHETSRTVVIHSLVYLTTPVEKRLPIAALLTRANYGLVLGNFEMDFEDGEIRYKTSLCVEGGELTLPMMHHLFAVNIATTDQWLPAINQVLYNHSAPEEAYNIVRYPDNNTLFEDDEE